MRRTGRRRSKPGVTPGSTAPTPVGTSKKTAEAITEMALSSVKNGTDLMKFELILRDKKKNPEFRKALEKARREGRESVERLLTKEFGISRGIENDQGEEDNAKV